ncbi:hypothetical protein HYW35_03735 [Candidatus Saccharibacteria bacterium]|nr:hypothetical protein [Candidatus Saccharibacteria bacterium]
MSSSRPRSELLRPSAKADAKPTFGWQRKSLLRGSLLDMKRAKKISALALGIIYLFLSSGLALADSRPYFKVFGGDVFSGGWFNSGTNCDTATSSFYQYPSYQPAGYNQDDRTGGILSFAKQNGDGNSLGGASSQYGAFALGIIEGSAAGDASSHGFYSAGAQAATGTPTSRNLLSFANAGSSASVWGGKFDGDVPQSNCIADYYAKFPDPAPPALASLDSSTASGVYSASAGSGTTYSLNVSAVSLRPGTKITIYVNGNVFISQNIVYQLDKVDNVPKFALVAKGNIYIDPGVTQLDGVYIAQPTSGTDGGDIWTCHPNNTDVVLYTYPSSCTNQLVVNGSLIAKRVALLRIKGDVTAASTSEDNLSTVAACTSAPGSCNIAEIINYPPAMVVGGPFFNPPPPPGLPVDSLIALPPVF